MKRRKFIELSSIGVFIASWPTPNLDDHTPLTGSGIATNEGDSVVMGAGLQVGDRLKWDNVAESVVYRVIGGDAFLKDYYGH